MKPSTKKGNNIIISIYYYFHVSLLPFIYFQLIYIIHILTFVIDIYILMENFNMHAK